jgi:hypothetical protein
MADTTIKKLVSSVEIADKIGCARTTALRMLKSGYFGTVIKLSFNSSRTHYRLKREDWESYLSREFKSQGIQDTLFD